MTRIPASKRTRGPAIVSVEERAARRVKNAEALRRVLAWMGKDKGVPELAAFLNCTRASVSNYMQRLSDGTEGRCRFADLVLAKLPLAPAP